MSAADVNEKRMILRRAFWSGGMSYRKWRGIMRKGPEGHRKAFWQSFHYLPMRWLLREIGEDRFIDVWPGIRSEFSTTSPGERTARDAWDAVWGLLAVGDSQYPVDPHVAGLSRKRREILRFIVCNPGISAYAVARKMKRDYSRVYKDIRELVEKGMIEAGIAPVSPRHELQLVPRMSANAILRAGAVRGARATAP